MAAESFSAWWAGILASTHITCQNKARCRLSMISRIPGRPVVSAMSVFRIWKYHLMPSSWHCQFIWTDKFLQWWTPVDGWCICPFEANTETSYTYSSHIISFVTAVWSYFHLHLCLCSSCLDSQLLKALTRRFHFWSGVGRYGDTCSEHLGQGQGHIKVKITDANGVSLNFWMSSHTNFILVAYIFRISKLKSSVKSFKVKVIPA